MSEVALVEALARPVHFEERPTSLPADVRTVWRVPLLLLLIAASRGGRPSWHQLHVLNWAVRTPDGRERLRAYVGGTSTGMSVIVRYEPALEDAIALTVGVGFAKWTGGRRLELTDRGRRAVEELEQTDTLHEERDFFQDVGRKLSQAAVERMVTG